MTKRLKGYGRIVKLIRVSRSFLQQRDGIECLVREDSFRCFECVFLDAFLLDGQLYMNLFVHASFEQRLVVINPVIQCLRQNSILVSSFSEHSRL